MVVDFWNYISFIIGPFKEIVEDAGVMMPLCSRFGHRKRLQ